MNRLEIIVRKQILNVKFIFGKVTNNSRNLKIYLYCFSLRKMVEEPLKIEFFIEIS